MQVNTEDLVDASEVAEILGLGQRQSVNTYRKRYADFPEPVLTKNSGLCTLWLRQNIEDWRASRRHTARKPR